MPTHRIKSREVDAIQVADLWQQVSEGEDYWSKLPGWVAEEYQSGKLHLVDFGVAVGSTRGEKTDWIIRDLGGLTLVTNDAFVEFYEATPSI